MLTQVFIKSVSNITKCSSSVCAMDQGLRPSSTQALNCLIKVCSGFQVDYLLCDDYENENERKERNGKIFNPEIVSNLIQDKVNTADSAFSY